MIADIHNCILCKLAKREDPVSVVYEDELVLALMDIKPINAGHILVIPKEHLILHSELPDEVHDRIFRVARLINDALRETKLARGINLFLADGEEAGQEVFHFHLHIIPRFKDDGFGFTFPDDYEELPTRNELDDIAEILSKELKPV